MTLAVPVHISDHTLRRKLLAFPYVTTLLRRSMVQMAVVAPAALFVIGSHLGFLFASPGLACCWSEGDYHPSTDERPTATPPVS